MSKQPRRAESAATPRSSASLPAAILQPQHTSSESVEAYAAQFADGTPYPHFLIRNIFPDPLLRAVRDEIMAGELFTKRNDLYDFAQVRGELRGFLTCRVD